MSKGKKLEIAIMSSLMGSHGMALATAMAVSGTVILVAMCRQRPLADGGCSLRPCIASGQGRKDNIQKKKKRVRFGEDVVVEFLGDDHVAVGDDERAADEGAEMKILREDGRGRGQYRKMPANRAALYSGIMQARLQRMACY